MPNTQIGTAPRRKLFAQLAFTAILWGVPTALCAMDDWQTWVEASWAYVQSGPWEAGVRAEMRWTQDASRLGTIETGHRVSYRWNRWLKTGLNLTYEEARPAGGGTQSTWRPELEVIASGQLGETLTWTIRQRGELRFRENRSEATYRYRLRPELRWKVSGAGPLQALFVRNELFHDFAINQWNHNRLVPLGASFQIDPNTRCDVSALILSSRSGAHWSHSGALAVEFKF